MTICRIKQEDRIKAVIHAHKQGKKALQITLQEPQDDEEARDIENEALGAITNLIIQKTKGHGLAKIVDAILRAKGFTTYVSPAGPDKGVDILASAGILGFGSPKICVQVKVSSKPAEALCYFAKLFQMERDFAALTVEERFAKRLEQEKPILEALLAWANRLKPQTAPKSAFGKALHYLLEQRPYLVRYLEDGSLEFSNNRAERSIKPFVMGRKNFLFCNTPGGAQSSAVLYSLMETAKETGLDPYRYLRWVLERAPELAQAAVETWAEKLIPVEAPEECRTKI